jgi:hypothetical protein
MRLSPQGCIVNLLAYGIGLVSELFAIADWFRLARRDTAEKPGRTKSF